MLADKPFGEWNTLPHPPGRRAHHGLPERQARRRPRPHGELLGPQACRCPQTGPIQLQTHGGEIRWRNVFVREIPRRRGERAARASTTPPGFTPTCSTARTSTGWGGPIDELRGQGRRHRLQAGQGRQHLHQGASTATSSPAWSTSCRPAATTGWRSATPARATRAYVGMCEVQILDDTAPEVRQARPAAVQRLGLRHGARPTAATSGRSASGTSWRSTVEGLARSRSS